MGGRDADVVRQDGAIGGRCFRYRGVMERAPDHGERKSPASTAMGQTEAGKTVVIKGPRLPDPVLLSGEGPTAAETVAADRGPR